MRKKLRATVHESRGIIVNHGVTGRSVEGDSCNVLNSRVTPSAS